MTLWRGLSLSALALLVAAPAHGAQRALSVTDFDQIEATGAMTVFVSRANATTAVISGDPHDLETLDVSVHGHTLRVGPAHFGWGSSTVAHGPLTVRVSTPRLNFVGYTGSGAISIDQPRGAQVTAWLAGSGSMSIGQVAVETLSLAVSGSGRVTAAGRAAQAKLEAIGSAVLDAEALTIEDATLTAYGAAQISVDAQRRAEATTTGAASITVTGSPACITHNTGAGVIHCG